MILERSDSHTFKAMLESGDEEYPGCVLHLGAFGWRLTCNMPPLIKPDILQVRGQYNYDELIERRYGLYLFDNHFNVCYGRGDANFNRDILGEEQRWSCFLPWNEWRHVRHSLYDVAGAHFYSDFSNNYDAFREKEAEVPKVIFRFKDFDGEEIEATTHVEEREWLRGEGWFKWLSFFCRRKVSRSLCITFNKETGRRKGSWKGGTIGHSIESVQGEPHETAFRRYCDNHDMEFVGEVLR
jgi:hypothetical protein